jgi:hypothetical protein
MRVTSGFRCDALNTAIGGSKTSVHPEGLGTDFDCAGFGDEEAVYNRLEIFMEYARRLESGDTLPGVSGQNRAAAEAFREVDQLIFEYAAWIHIGLSNSTPRHMSFIQS